jgi:hypothetical protein
VNRRGGILLEMVLAIGLFAGAAIFVLGTLRQASDSMRLAAAKQEALDEARSLMARLEVGLINVADLREGSAELARHETLAIRVRNAPTEFRGLTLIEIEVTEREAPGRSLCRLRQLVKLRGVAPGRDRDRGS